MWKYCKGDTPHNIFILLLPSRVPFSFYPGGKKAVIFPSSDNDKTPQTKDTKKKLFFKEVVQLKKLCAHTHRARESLKKCISK